MNIIDCILVGAVFLFALVGFAAGMLKQFLGILGIIVSLFAGYLFYKNTGNLLLVAVVIAVAGLIFKIAIYVIKKIYFNLRKEKERISLYSRMGGMLIGGFKGAAYVFIVLICIYSFEGIVGAASPDIARYFEDSFFYSYLKQGNLLSGAPLLKKIHFASKLISKKAAGNLLENDAAIYKLRQNPSVKAVLEDKELQQSMQNKDYGRILSNPKFIELLRDKEFLNQIASVDYENIYKQQKGGKE